MSGVEKEVRLRLMELEDREYRNFQKDLVPTVDPETIIGIRTPELRKLAKELAKSQNYIDFLKCLPHEYFDENNLHALLIERLKDYGQVIFETNAFLPYIDNWATCDLLSPKIFKKHLPELDREIRRWIKSEHTYTIRFAVKMLMSFYLDEDFSPEYPKLVSQIRSDEYYVNMMIAWYFATALAKKYDEILPYIENRRLSVWTHNKTIQKAIESRRITNEQKTYLRTLKIK